MKQTNEARRRTSLARGKNNDGTRSRTNVGQQQKQHLLRSRAVKVSMITTYTLLLLATPNEAATRLAKMIRRPRIVQYTIEVDSTITEYNNNGELRIDVMPSSEDIVQNKPTQRPHRRHRTPWQRHDNDQQQRALAESNNAIVGGNHPSKRLAQLKRAFSDAVVEGTKKRRRVNNSSNARGGYDADTAPHVHVGKMLSAVKEMEEHMRAVGMTQTANDLKSNIEKATRLYRSAPAERRDSLHDLLQWELETGIHGDNNNNNNNRLRVSNRSGAMGLFWIGHSVEYQNDMYRLMLEEGKTPIQAADAAFEHTLEPHMEWATKKIARAAIPRLTPGTQTKFFSILSGYDEECYGPQQHMDVTRDVHSILDVWGPMIDDWKATFDDLQLTDI